GRGQGGTFCPARCLVDCAMRCRASSPPTGAAAVIRSLEIKGLRGIRTGSLTDLTPLVVLVGPNGAGKSTILEALLIAANSRPPEAIGEAADRRKESGASARWLLWKGGHDGPAEITLAA